MECATGRSVAPSHRPRVRPPAGMTHKASETRWRVHVVPLQAREVRKHNIQSHIQLVRARHFHPCTYRMNAS